MSTPKTPGPRLPEKPVRPPTIARRTPAAEPPTDTASVLDRLRAAQPRTTAPGEDDRSEPSAGPSSGPSTRTPTGTPSGPGASAPGPRPGGDAGRSDDSGPEGVGGARSSERLRIAAEKARAAADAAAGVARRSSTAAAGAARRSSTAAVGAARRGSTAAARHVGAWDQDVVRQIVVSVCAVACILGSAAGVGAFGGPSIRDAAGGLFAPDATLLAPSSSAFSIWSVIYVGLVAYTAFQWLPSQRRTERQRRLGWIAAVSMLLNLAWILCAQADLPVLSLVVIMLLFFTLLAAVRAMNDHPTGTRLEGALVDTPIGLYLGWVLVAASANAAAVLTAGGIDLFGWGGRAWAILGIVAVLVSAAVICSTDRGRLAVAAATSWGLLWIAVERVLGQPFAVNVAFVAALAIFLLLITAGSRRHRVDHAYRRWLRAQEDAQREPIDLTGDYYEESRY